MSERRLLTQQQLCKQLGIGDHTVRRLRSEGLPFVRVGKRRMMFDVAEVVEWLKREYPNPIKKAS